MDYFYIGTSPTNFHIMHHQEREAWMSVNPTGTIVFGGYYFNTFASSTDEGMAGGMWPEKSMFIIQL